MGETLRLWLRLRREEPPAQLHPEQGQVSRRNLPSVIAGAVAAVIGALVFWKARHRDE
jgi:hypothetical protein